MEEEEKNRVQKVSIQLFATVQHTIVRRLSWHFCFGALLGKKKTGCKKEEEENK